MELLFPEMVCAQHAEMLHQEGRFSKCPELHQRPERDHEDGLTGAPDRATLRLIEQVTFAAAKWAHLLAPAEGEERRVSYGTAVHSVSGPEPRVPSMQKSRSHTAPSPATKNGSSKRFGQG